MNSLTLYMVAVLLPVFFASPRTAPWWLGLQAVALAWSMAAQHGVHSLHAAVALTEIVLVRGLFAPWLLSRVTTSDDASERQLPSNLFSWMLGGAVVVLGFEFAAMAAPGSAMVALGSVCSSILLALLILALNDAGVAQIFALLLMENAALLFELSLPELWSPLVHGLLAFIYIATVWSAVRRLQGYEAALHDEMARPVR